MKQTFLSLKSKIVPLAFGILITISFMYQYDANLMILFILCSTLIQGLIYLFYDYISSKNRVMQYVSILGSLIAIIFIIIIMGSLYTTGNMLDFIVWFLSPQGAVEYSLQYILVVLIGINFFIASTIYYFTQIRYRMITTFFLLLIPFAMFAKEGNPIPIIFLLPLVVLYFTTLIVCGQNNVYKQKNVKTIKNDKINNSYVKSVGTFVLTFMLIVSAIPKAQITANRDIFETLINANNLTDYLLSQLGNFTDTSNGQGFSVSSNAVVFTAKTSETVAVKSRTFSNYNFKNNVWLRSDGIKSLIENSTIDTTLHHNDTTTNLIDYDINGELLDNNTTSEFQKTLNPAELLNAIVFACTQDNTFAEKYNLNSINSDATFESCIRQVSIFNTNRLMSFILNPTNTFNFDVKNQTSANYYKTDSGICYALLDNSNNTLINVDNYTLDYYSSSMIFSNTDAFKILSKLNFNTYGDFLMDLSSIVEGSKFDNVVSAYMQDYQNAVIYSTVFTDCNSEKILNLAEEITKDCNSDIEKAYALENYFISNGYNYDTNFKQEKGSTIEAFLFENKTGACYDYSTSMILMARALGLPARYVEGFLINNYAGSNDNIKVTTNDSHAYPEVYISGYGWCYFEPTQTLLSEEENTKTKLSESYELFIVSLSIVILAILISTFVIFVYPKIYEKYFRKKVLTKPLGSALSCIIDRIRKISKLPNTQTLEETKKSILALYNVDITNIIDIANIVFYGNPNIEKSKELELIQNCLNTYIALYDTILQVAKMEKKSKKSSKSI